MKGRATLLLLLLLCGLSALGATRLVLAARNTLDLNGRWSSGKVGLEQAVIGAAATMVTGVTLARDRLDLSVYEGFQLFVHEADDDVGFFAFDAQGTDAYLHVVFGPLTGPLSGIRLGHDARFAELAYRVDETGRFLSQRSVTLASHLHARATNRIALSFGPEGAVLELNGSRALELPGDFSAVRRVGVRGPRKAMSVDDVVVADAEGRVLLGDDFTNHRGEWGWRLGLGLAAIALSAGGLWLGRSRPRRARAVVLAVALSVTLAVWIAWWADREFLSRRYPQTAEEIDFGEYANRIESSEDVLRRVRAELAVPADDRQRVLLVGTSQTWGAGAGRTEETWATRLGPLLGATRPTVVVAAAIPGSHAAELFGHYRDEWVEWEPDLVVINLSSNDRANPDFGKDIEAFLELNAERGIETLLVLEPNSIEAVHSIAHNHQALREIGVVADVEVLDMHGYLAEQIDRGWLWWDFVHLTSFGQELFAERLAEAISDDR